MKEIYMQEALNEAYLGIKNGHGGPFGAVIVKDNKIIGSGHNCVLRDTDPTLHGEIMAIKDACRTLSSFDLSGSEIYTTAEPCPMCFGAILWARIDKIYYGCNRLDTDSIGFRDSAFYDILTDNKAAYELIEFQRDKCLELFETYMSMQNKQMY